MWSCPGSELHQFSDELAVQILIEFFILDSRNFLGVEWRSIGV
jgi:hypothetical protein